MRLFIAILILTLCFATVVLAGSPAQLMGSVEAVYHEGVMSFRVDHADAISISIKVYDLETDALVFDSGPRERTLVTWPAGHDVTGSFRYVVTAWNADGEVVVSQAAVTKSFRYVVTAWNADGEVVVSQAAVTKSFTPIADITFDTIPGDTKLLGPNEIIMESDVQVGVPQGARIYANYDNDGGAIFLYEEAGGAYHTRLFGDATGTGGYMMIEGPSGYVAAQGNFSSHGNEAWLRVEGTSDFVVYAGDTGTSSVQMPASAVSATEMENEPGVASTYSTSSVTMTTTAANVLIRTITPPTSGYVFATATVDFYLNHANGTPTRVWCSISNTSNTMYTSGEVYAQISLAATSGGYRMSVPMTRILSVPSGSNQLYVVCDSSGGTITAYDRTFDLLFVPTAYGLVSTEIAGGGENIEDISEGLDGLDVFSPPNLAMTQAELNAEQAESIAFNLARIQAELAELQAMADSLTGEELNQP